MPVFSTLEEADLERIAQLAVPRSFDAGQVVFREGDRSDTCYVVHVGRARAVHEHGDGRTITLATFGPGDIFGELALFEDERRSATVETLEPTSAVAVLGPDMRRLMAEHPQIAMRLLIALGRRLRETNERLARRSFQTVQSRVASALSELVAQAQAQRPAGSRGLPPGLSPGRDRSSVGDDAQDHDVHDPRHPGRSGEARGQLARVGEPLPGGAGARGGHLPGQGPAGRCTTRRRCARMSSEDGSPPAQLGRQRRPPAGPRSARRAGWWCTRSRCS